MVDLQCDASISFDPNESEIIIAYTSSQGVSGQLRLLVTINNLIDLSAMFQQEADNSLDVLEQVDLDDEEIPF